MELQGKILNFLGDSITEDVGVTNLENRYDNRIKKQYGLKEINNYGLGGTRLAHQQRPSLAPCFDLCFCGRAYLMKKNADAVVVYGGVNDYIHGDAPFGEMSDVTPATFCGAVYFLMNALKILYPTSKIVFVTPAHCFFCGRSDSIPFEKTYEKLDAKPLKEYVDVIKSRGKKLDVPVLDMFESLELDPNRESDRLSYTTDGLHFNDEGHSFIAKAIGDFLISI